MLASRQIRCRCCSEQCFMRIGAATVSRNNDWILFRLIYILKRLLEIKRLSWSRLQFLTRSFSVWVGRQGQVSVVMGQYFNICFWWKKKTMRDRLQRVKWWIVYSLIFIMPEDISPATVHICKWLFAVPWDLTRSHPPYYLTLCGRECEMYSLVFRETSMETRVCSSASAGTNVSINYMYGTGTVFDKGNENKLNGVGWGQDQIDAMSQTIHSNAFSRMKMNEFRLGFHWSLFLGLELTIFQHWFR